MKIKREQLVIIISLAAAIAVLIIYIILFSPVMGRLKAAHRECRALESEVLNVRQQFVLRKPQTSSRVFAPEAEASSCIDEITKLGRLKNVNFTSITPKQTEAQQDYKVLPIEMDIEAAFNELAAFLGSLGRLQKSPVTIRNFKVTAAKDNASKLKANLLINMYLQQ